MKHIKEMSVQAAEECGCRPLTTAYYLPSEQWMLDKVLADMQRGNIEAVLVPDGGGVEVWRKASEMRTFEVVLKEALRSGGSATAA